MHEVARIRGVETKSLHYWLLFTAVLGIYFFAGKLGLSFAFVHASASPVWPPTGIALAAVLLFGNRIWPAIFLGALLVNVTTSGSALSSLGIAAGNTLEAVVGAFLVERYASGTGAFYSAHNFLRFALLAGLISTAISATIGVTSLAATGQAAWSAFATIWVTWWLGDAAGALIVAPFLVLWGVSRSAGPLRDHPVEAAALLLIVVASALVVFVEPQTNRYPLPFLCIPPLIWAAFRFGQREVATAVVILSLIATWATVGGTGPFVMGSDNESLLLLQTFMATIVALTLPVAALVWERKAIEQERSTLLSHAHAARDEAEAANRAKDEFLAMLSHELRNPLAAITNATHVLLAHPKEQTFVGRAAEIIDRQARHLTRLIEDLLDVARVTSGKLVLDKRSVDLAEAVQKTLVMMRSSGSLAGHEIATDLKPVWVKADPDRLAQVIANLVNNAIKYTPPGGRIEVKTAAEGNQAVLQVRDSGVGIAPELLPRIFDLFTQGPRALDRSQGGLGVGLTLVRRLIEDHGGRVAATSEGLSKGTTVVVHLPRIEPPLELGARSQHAAAPPAKRILIIEDDEDSREALRMQLTLAGHQVFEAGCGTSGLAVASETRPEIVLLDIGLPELDGYEVARRLKAANGAVRVVAITGYGQPEDRERSAAAGIDRHLVKPVDADDLHRALI